MALLCQICRCSTEDVSNRKCGLNLCAKHFEEHRKLCNICPVDNDADRLYSHLHGSNHPLIRSRSNFDLSCISDLIDILQGRLLALRVANFFPPNLCLSVVQKFMESQNFRSYYNTESGTPRVGMGLNEVEFQAGVEINGKSFSVEQNLERYYRLSIPAIHHIRETFSPYLSPIDKLRVLLDELWPGGAKMEQLEVGTDKKLMVGLIRVIGAGKTVNPHQDVLAWTVDQIPHNCENLLGQLTCNVYIQVPEIGGELKLWSKSLERTEYSTVAQGQFGIAINKQEILGGPPLVLKPETGEIIFFNCTKLHAINASSTDRVACTCFLGFRGTDKPITFWN